MKALFDFVVLPAKVSAAEARYLSRLNRVALWLFALQVPLMTLVAVLAGQSIGKAAVFASVAAIGPFLANAAFDNPRHRARLYGFGAMVMGGLFVHFGQGPMQIEMHFYFFVVLAMLAAFGDPLVILIAAGTLLLHHFGLFFLLPRSVFNYSAPLSAVGVHALFFGVEAAAMCFVARTFFDRVIGAERMVEDITKEIVARARSLSLVLDSVGQGFLVVGPDCRLPAQRSRILETWLGSAEHDDTLWSYVGRSDANAAAWLRAGWEALFEGVLPTELSLDQLPKRMKAGERVLELSYRMTDDGTSLGVLVVISDVSHALERERAEHQKEELIAAIDWLLRDRNGFAEFLNEATDMVERLVSRDCDLDEEKRLIHTLKGNAATFGLRSLALACHELETHMAESGEPLDGAKRAGLEGLYQRSSKQLRQLVERRDGSLIEVSTEEHGALVKAVRNGATTLELVHLLDELKLEPLDRRLGRMAKQAEELALRLGKNVKVGVHGSAVRMDPMTLQKVWSPLVHLVRNALDHGIETDEERALGGKKCPASLFLNVRSERDGVVIEFEDDGRGIDWSKVAEHAMVRGLPHEGKQALEDALFADGLSTRTHASEMSGRGVGLSAVRHAVRAVGGVIRVDSRTGKGTRFSVHIPRPRRESAASIHVTRKVPPAASAPAAVVIR